MMECVNCQDKGYYVLSEMNESGTYCNCEAAVYRKELELVKKDLIDDSEFDRLLKLKAFW